MRPAEVVKVWECPGPCPIVPSKNTRRSGNKIALLGKESDIINSLHKNQEPYKDQILES